jgi:probable FeS assembly SUF system protein SufT
MSSTYRLVRDCAATLIPAGDIVVLEAGSEVTVTQALGGSVTVRTGMGLFRIAPQDLDALGAEAARAHGGQATDTAAAGPLDQDMLWEALKGCFDPEIPVNIVDLGLIYHLELQPGERGGQKVAAKMTLTAQGCGMGPVIAADAKAKLEALPGVESAEVQIVWDPVWNPRMISEAGRKQLGLE